MVTKKGIAMALRKITLTVCDVCESEKDVQTWAIGVSGSTAKKYDLCETHRAPVVAVLESIKSGKVSKPAPSKNGRRTTAVKTTVPAKKAAAPRRRTGKKVVSLEEIEASKKS